MHIPQSRCVQCCIAFSELLEDTLSAQKHDEAVEADVMTGMLTDKLQAISGIATSAN